MEKLKEKEKEETKQEKGSQAYTKGKRTQAHPLTK
jgi:hypothetical protein